MRWGGEDWDISFVFVFTKKLATSGVAVRYSSY